jgi:hypothetical protein
LLGQLPQLHQERLAHILILGVALEFQGVVDVVIIGKVEQGLQCTRIPR